MELWVPKQLADGETPLSEERLRLAAVSCALMELPGKSHRPAYSPPRSEDCENPPNLEVFLRFRHPEDLSTFCIEEE